MTKHRDNWKKDKTKTILGLPCEYLKSKNPPRIGGYTTEYRLKNNDADIWEYSEGHYRVVVTSRSLAIALLNSNAQLITAPPNAEFFSPSEGFVFEFDESEGRKVLLILGFLSPASIKHTGTPSETTQTDQGIPNLGLAAETQTVSSKSNLLGLGE